MRTASHKLPWDYFLVLYLLLPRINEKDSAGLEENANKTFLDGDTLPCGLISIKFEDQKSPGESAFFLKERGVMILGDALIGKVPGKNFICYLRKLTESLIAGNICAIPKTSQDFQATAIPAFSDRCIGIRNPTIS